MEKSSSDFMPACMRNKTVDVLTPLQCSGRNNTTHSAYWEMGDNMVKHEGAELYSDVSPILLQSMSDMINVEHQEFGEIRPINARECEGGSSGCKNMILDSEQNRSSFLNNSAINNAGVYDLIHQEKNSSYTPLKFPAGCELLEALGPSSLKGSKYFDWLAQVNQDMKIVDVSDVFNTSQLTSESHPEHLLEAMVANICHSSNNDVNSELSFCRSMQSALSSGKTIDTSIQDVHTIDHTSLVREDKNHCLSSSSKVVSSTCPSACSEQFERSSEPSKNSKRARPGESCRPRPRDRQLIQDRIKELRELVPNGAKVTFCNIFAPVFAF